MHYQVLNFTNWYKKIFNFIFIIGIKCFIDRVSERYKEIKMNKFIVGDKVKIATQPDVVFVISHVNHDHSYEIQYQLSDQQVLKYGNIAAEMLQKVENTQ